MLFTAAGQCIPNIPGLSAASTSGTSEVFNPPSSCYFGKSVRQCADILQFIGTTRLNFDEEFIDQNKNAAGFFSGCFAHLSY